jgi:hypothetical protein
MATRTDTTTLRTTKTVRVEYDYSDLIAMLVKNGGLFDMPTNGDIRLFTRNENLEEVQVCELVLTWTATTEKTETK